MSDITEPTLDDYGSEVHPAWGVIGASRVSSTGTILFDSDIPHQHYVVVTLSAARRSRDLHRDHIRAGREIVEIAMSEAQWASFVSTMNAGDGVPVTINRRDYQSIPGFPYEPRLAESMKEVREAADQSMQKITDAMAAYKTHKTASNLRTLEATISNGPANMKFAASSLTEHAENVVQRSSADIEAMVVAKSKQLGIEPESLGGLPQLTPGPEQDN